MKTYENNIPRGRFWNLRARRDKRLGKARKLDPKAVLCDLFLRGASHWTLARSLKLSYMEN